MAPALDESLRSITTIANPAAADSPRLAVVNNSDLLRRVPPALRMRIPASRCIRRPAGSALRSAAGGWYIGGVVQAADGPPRSHLSPLYAPATRRLNSFPNCPARTRARFHGLRMSVTHATNAI